MSDETENTFVEFSRREIKRRARAMFPHLVRSMAARAILFMIVVIAVGLVSKPWKWEWLKPDEASSIAKEFLSKQNIEVEEYTDIRAVDYEPDGVWNGRDDEHGFQFRPAVSYILRFFKEGEEDNWTIHVSPAGRIHRVQRDFPDDEPGYSLTHDQALETVLEKLSTDLSLPAYRLTLISDSLSVKPLRSDWNFVFSMTGAKKGEDKIYVRLSGKGVTRFATAPEDNLFSAPVRGGAARSRLMAFSLMIFGVFLIVLHHRSPIAWKKGALYGGIAFVLVLIIRGLTFTQSAILVPADIEAGGYFIRVALGGIIEAVQVSILVGLIVATGESISRDLLPNVTTFTRIAPSHRGWVGAWIQAGRYALPVAAIVLAYESVIALWFEPGGLSGKALPIIAGTLTSPNHTIASMALVCRDVLWDEGLYRLWLFPLLIFWVRGPLTAILFTSAIATYFAGFDLSNYLSIGGGQYIIWSLVAGWLMMRVGILGTMLFHFLVLGSYVGLALIWTGFGMTAGILLIIAIVLILTAIVAKADHLIRTAGESA